MGICQQCYEEKTQQTLDGVKTLNLKTGPQYNGIQFTFTNKPINQLKGDCVVFYADHVTQLSKNQPLTSIHKKTKRKIFEYLTVAQQQCEKNKTKHAIVPISISSIGFKYLLFVKIEPWDGHERRKMQQKIHDLTVGYLQSFKMRKLKNFTIAEFDLYSGIHHSVSFPPISKAIQKYCSDIKSVNMLCNSVESVDYFYKKIKSSQKAGSSLINTPKKNKSKKKSIKGEEKVLF